MTQPRGIKPSPSTDPWAVAVAKFLEMNPLYINDEDNASILRAFIQERQLPWNLDSLVLAYGFMKDKLKHNQPAPPPAKPQPKNIGGDSGGMGSGRKNHAAPENESTENKVSVGTGWTAMLRKAKWNRERIEAAKAEEQKRYEESAEVRRAKVPPRY